jgi:hydrogenase maturation protein HypF
MVQHHAAHIAAIAAEHDLDGEVLGLAWDGTGLGHDGAIWGSEGLVLEGQGVARIAHLASFPLPGGDRAAREPRRAALGLLRQMAPEQMQRRARAWFCESELVVLERALAGNVNAPRCSSLGRLFDAVAALLGVRAKCSYEGQAAAELEALAEMASGEDAYPLPLSATQPQVADTAALVGSLLADIDHSVPRERMARRLHFALVEHALEIAECTGLSRVVLSGGCFQNRLLARHIRRRLEQAGFAVYSAGEVPCNDGGIAVGQIALASKAEQAPCA